MAYTAKDPCPPQWRFLYLRETKSWWCEEGGEGGGGGEGEGGEGEKKVSMLTHTTTRGQCPNKGGGSDQIPTSLTDLSK